MLRLLERGVTAALGEGAGAPGVGLIHFNKGQNAILNVRMPDGTRLHAKLSEFQSLVLEFQRFQRAWQTFGEFTPQPLGFAEEGGWQLILAQEIDHKPVAPKDLLSPRLHPQLAAFFQCCRPDPAQRLKDNLDGLLDPELLASYGLDHAARIWQAYLADHLADLPAIPQHGDLSCNNLGLHQGRLLVFDWEDYGKTCLPGFDLTILLLSILNFDATALLGVLHGGDHAPPPASLIAPVCQSLKLSPPIYRQLAPLHLMVFLVMKSSYSEAIRRTIRSVISEFERQEKLLP